jgi:hypothetical protein
MPRRKKKLVGKIAENNAMREARLTRIEDMLLRGIKNQAVIARAFGVSECQISKDVTKIRERWGQRDPDKKEMQKQERLVQLEDILRQALNAFDRSRRDIEDYKVIVTPCEGCGATGNYTNKDGMSEPCRRCGGKGKHVQETTTVKESPGDPSFLKLAKECVMDAARLQGVVTDGKVGMLRTVAETEGIGGTTRESVELFYADVPADDIIGAMVALDKLRNRQKKKLENSPIITTAVQTQAYDEDVIPAQHTENSSEDQRTERSGGKAEEDVDG